MPVIFKYLVQLPKDYSEKERSRWPLLIFLHGRGERGDNLSQVKRHGPPKLIAAGRSFPFIVISPQCPAIDAWWNVPALDAFTSEMATRYKVDKRRIYLTGLSMGGFATWGLASRCPKRFAAIVPICGGGEPHFAPRIKQLPVWAFHGAKDTVVPLSRSQEMIDAIKAKGGSPRFTIYPQAGHDSWTSAYENREIYAWLLCHQLPAKRGRKSLRQSGRRPKAGR